MIFIISSQKTRPHFISVNYSILFTRLDLEQLVISTFVNDIKIIGSENIKVHTKVTIELITTFEMLDIRSISFYLGLKVDKNCEKKIIKLS